MIISFDEKLQTGYTKSKQANIQTAIKMCDDIHFQVKNQTPLAMAVQASFLPTVSL